MTPKDPFLEGTFWDKFWRPIRSRVLLFTPEIHENGKNCFRVDSLGETPNCSQRPVIVRNESGWNV